MSEILALQHRPKRCSHTELRKVGVNLDEFSSGIMRECDCCGKRWFPRYTETGKMGRGYWKCPYRCNVPLMG